MFKPPLFQIVSIIGTIACLALLVGYTANSDKVVEVVVEQHPELVPQEVDNGDLSEAVGIGKYFFFHLLGNVELVLKSL